VLGADGPNPRALLMPAQNMWDMRESARLADAVARELPGVDVTGEFTMLAAVHRMLQRDTPIVGAIAVALVVLFTALDLRRVRATLGALGVLAAGMCWWGALVVLSGQRLSLVNVVGIPIVLGIGVDVMIHLVHRLHQEGPGSILKALATTGWASALGTSTTVVAFAALSFASARGVRSLGLVVLLGETAVTVAGFVLVPLGFATAWRMQGRTPHTLAARAAARSQDESPPAA
jgi:predicted RND superfamily exporter protein